MLKGKNKKAPYENIDTIISENVLFKGDFNSEGSVRIDGEVEGQVKIKGDLVLGDKGSIKGDILVANILVSGTVEGTIVAEGRLEITPTGKIKGGVQCKTLVVEEGGIIQGNCKMLMDEETTKPLDNLTKLYSAADY
ncbi:MAG: polymer-forming cytoskeletal protein [Syntrophomonadaceae bacterium]|nr:polymer-forming cytoskeletal protein [Syntrophomonadaceae bacterium]